MNYLHHQVRDTKFALDTPQRRAFRKHLDLVAAALEEIESVDSADSSPGAENAAILACLPDETRIAAVTAEAKSTIKDLVQLMDEILKKGKDS